MTTNAAKLAQDKRRRMFVRAVKAGHAMRAEEARKALAARNSYRALLGLPLLEHDRSLMRSHKKHD